MPPTSCTYCITCMLPPCYPYQQEHNYRNSAMINKLRQSKSRIKANVHSIKLMYSIQNISCSQLEVTEINLERLVMQLLIFSSLLGILFIFIFLLMINCLQLFHFQFNCLTLSTSSSNLTCPLPRDVAAFIMLYINTCVGT